jgi:hypothetical protein
MLVVNCEVDEKCVLKETASSSNKAQRRKKRHKEDEQSVAGDVLAAATSGVAEQSTNDSKENLTEMQESTDVFYPVLCAVCRTEVGVRDSDEVYHFFHVFPSNA